MAQIALPAWRSLRLKRNDRDHAPVLATRRPVAIELRLRHIDWTSVCLAQREIVGWQDNAIVEIEEREHLHPDTWTAIHHAFRLT
jgi:hypothetical protein